MLSLTTEPQSLASRVYDDILHSIFPFLKLRELARVSGVSRHWNKLVAKNKSRNETIQGFDIDYVERPLMVNVANLNTSRMELCHVQEMSNMTRHVSTLDLTRCQLNYCEFKFLNTFDHVTFLDVSFTGLLPNQILWTDLFRSMSKLTSLDVSKNFLGKYILSIHFSFVADLDNLAEALEDPNCGLKYLNLSDNEICQTGATRIAQAIHSNKSITSLNLDQNFIGTHGINEISNSLKCNTSITHLNLQRTTNSNSGIAELINASGTLQHLDISDNNPHSETADNEGLLIIEAIKHCSLTSFNMYMSDNLSNPKRAILLADALVFNQTLTCLDVSTNLLNDLGVCRIVDAVLDSKRITELNISNSDCGPKGLTSLCDLIKHSSRIRILHMNHLFKNMDDTDTIQLSEAIKCSQSLTHIHLGNNFLDHLGMTALAQAISVSSTLTFVGLENNHLEDMDVFASIVSKTKSVEIVFDKTKPSMVLTSQGPCTGNITINIWCEWNDDYDEVYGWNDEQDYNYYGN